MNRLSLSSFILATLFVSSLSIHCINAQPSELLEALLKPLHQIQAALPSMQTVEGSFITTKNNVVISVQENPYIVATIATCTAMVAGTYWYLKTRPNTQEEATFHKTSSDIVVVEPKKLVPTNSEYVEVENTSDFEMTIEIKVPARSNARITLNKQA